MSLCPYSFVVRFEEVRVLNPEVVFFEQKPKIFERAILMDVITTQLQSGKTVQRGDFVGIIIMGLAKNGWVVLSLEDKGDFR